MQPGQFFAAFLDYIPKSKKWLPPTDYKVIKLLAADTRKRGIIFALPKGGALLDRTKSDPIPASILRPPYPMCVLEFEGVHNADVPYASRSSRRIVIAADQGDRVILVPLAYADSKDMWEPPMAALAIPYAMSTIGRVVDGKLAATFPMFGLLPELFDAGIKIYGSKDSLIKEFSGEVVDELWAYLDFCRALNENEVAFDDVEPDAANNRMRRARGKVPLFTYKVLTIGKKKRKARHLGGTHASPRSHLRRGYYRTSKNGLRHWVQPCMVKGETDGFVHKDYRVEAPELEGADQ